MIRPVLGLVSLAALACVCLGSLTGGAGLAPDAWVESANPPADTTIGWMDPNTLAAYVYSPTAGLWVSPVVSLVGKNASSVTGALGIFLTGMVCDTTSASADGIMCADSTVLVSLSWSSSRYAGTAPNCTTQVYRCAEAGPSLVVQTVWAGAVGDSLLATAVFFGAYEPLAVYLKPAAVGATNPTMPQIDVGLFRFRRKT